MMGLKGSVQSRTQSEEIYEERSALPEEGPSQGEDGGRRERGGLSLLLDSGTPRDHHGHVVVHYISVIPLDGGVVCHREV